MLNVKFACSVQVTDNLKMIVKSGTIILSTIPYNTSVCVIKTSHASPIWIRLISRHHYTDKAHQQTSLQ
jgi:hypothetical protein